jgi:hypothetical protein
VTPLVRGVSILGYGMALLCCRAALLSVGMQRTAAVARRLAKPKDKRGYPVDPYGVVRDVAVAAALLPMRARCLEQSLVAHIALRRIGVDATLRLGVQPYGFIAHAWVEVAGRPVNERGELIRKLAVFPRPLL